MKVTLTKIADGNFDLKSRLTMYVNNKVFIFF